MSDKSMQRVGLAAVLAIGVVVASPLFKPRLLQGTDSLFHLYTLIQLDHLVQQDIFYTRWFPYQAGGMGLPLFQYYPPLAYYVAMAFRALGLEPLAALRLAWALTVVGSAAGMYGWVRAVAGRVETAVVAAVAYVGSPYLLFNAFFRAGFTEQMALLLVPWTLWAFYRLATTGQRRYWAVGALFYGALITAHTPTALVFSPVLLLYVAVLALGDANGTAAKSLGTALALGLGLAAFFWLPALLERGAIADFLATTPDLDYRRHFVPLDRLFSWPLTTAARPGLSAVALPLAGLALWDAWRGRFSRLLQQHLVLAAVVTAVCAGMALPFSASVWQAVPILRYFQFPHRFLGVATVFMAFLAGWGVTSLRRRVAGKRPSFSLPLLLLVAGLLLGHARVLLHVRHYPPLPAIDVDFIMQKERESGQIGTLYIANFVPETVETMPPFALLARDDPQRLDPSSLPASAKLVAARYRPLRYDLALSTAVPFTVRFYTFYFPGWQAQIDGRRVPVAPAGPHGFISVEIPAGQHDLAIWFGMTPLRRAATLVTVGSALVWAAIVMTGIRPPGGYPHRSSL